MARPAYGRIIIPIIMAHSCAIPTGTISKRCATARNDGISSTRILGSPEKTDCERMTDA
jgi:hypothetical protein